MHTVLCFSGDATRGGPLGLRPHPAINIFKIPGHIAFFPERRPVPRYVEVVLLLLEYLALRSRRSQFRGLGGTIIAPLHRVIRRCTPGSDSRNADRRRW